MTPIITEQDPDTGEWEIVTDESNEEATLDEITRLFSGSDVQQTED